MEKVNSRIANREEIESKLVKALKDLNKNKNQVKYIFTWWKLIDSLPPMNPPTNLCLAQDWL